MTCPHIVVAHRGLGGRRTGQDVDDQEPVVLRERRDMLAVE
jgi:hypothetical protein